MVQDFTQKWRDLHGIDTRNRYREGCVFSRSEPKVVSNINVLIAEDHAIVREGLKRIVAECADLSVVGEASDGDEALAKSHDTRVDVVLLDITMPGPGFLATLERFKQELPAVRVLVLSMHREELYALRAVRAGASGYLTKDNSPRSLAEAIRRVHAGEKYLSPSLLQGLLQRSPDQGNQCGLLSERELQVMLMLIKGNRIKAIARTLDLSPKTISTYRTRLLEKLGLATNADLVRYALDAGLLES